MEHDEPSRIERERRDLVDRLRDLAVLRDKGVLSEREFQRARVDVLAEFHGSEPPGGGMV